MDPYTRKKRKLSYSDALLLSASTTRKGLPPIVSQHRSEPGTRPPARGGYLPNDPASIAQYQKFHGLPPTGRVDSATRKKLKDQGSKLGPPRPPQDFPNAKLA